MNHTVNNYYPFGMLQPGRTYVGENGDYRYGFTGMEMDNEIKGKGNSYTTLYRQFDPRLGRWLSYDPKIAPWQSPYVSMGNKPTIATDILGDWIKFRIKRRAKKGMEKKGTSVKEYITKLYADEYGLKVNITKRLFGYKLSYDEAESGKIYDATKGISKTFL